MRQLTKKVSYEGNSQISERQATVKDATLVIKLLANMYSNPIQAVVREYTCNALDSHIAAGKADVPIFVTSPSILNPYFIVRDEGVGLSEEEVYDFFFSAGASNKTDSNLLIGGFGIGCFAGFSYVTDFQVTTIKDGVKRIFNVYWGTKGPSIEKLGEKPTTEHNGLTVRINVKAQDISTFQKEIQNVCQWFDPQPQIENFKINPIEWVLERETYGFHSGYEPNIKVKLGPVVYQTSIRNTFNKPCVLFFNIGDFQISPDRESIIEDEEAKQKIYQKIEQIKKYESDLLLKETRDQKTLYRAARVFYGTESTIMSKPQFQWRRKNFRILEVGEHVKLISVIISNGIISGVNLNPKYNRKLQDILAIFDTEGKTTNYTKKIKLFVQKNIDKFEKNCVFFVLVLNGTDKENLRHWIKCGRPDCISFKYSDVEIPKKAKGIAPTRIVQVHEYSYKDKYAKHDVKVDFLDKRKLKYLKMDNWQFKGQDLDRTVSSYAKLLNIQENILMIPKSHWNKIPDHWINLEPAIDKAILDLQDLIPDLEKEYNADIAKREIFNFFKRLPLDDLRSPKELKQYLEFKANLLDDYNKNYWEVYAQFLPKTKISAKHHEITDHVNKLCSQVINNYPLLKFVNYYSIEKGEGLNAVKDYISLIHKRLDK